MSIQDPDALADAMRRAYAAYSGPWSPAIDGPLRLPLPVRSRLYPPQIEGYGRSLRPASYRPPRFASYSLERYWPSGAPVDSPWLRLVGRCDGVAVVLDARPLRTPRSRREPTLPPTVAVGIAAFIQQSGD